MQLCFPYQDSGKPCTVVWNAIFRIFPFDLNQPTWIHYSDECSLYLALYWWSYLYIYTHQRRTFDFETDMCDCTQLFCCVLFVFLRNKGIWTPNLGMSVLLLGTAVMAWLNWCIHWGLLIVITRVFSVVESHRFFT